MIKKIPDLIERESKGPRIVKHTVIVDKNNEMTATLDEYNTTNKEQY